MTVESAYRKVLRIKQRRGNCWFIPGNTGRPKMKADGKRVLVSRVVAAMELGLDIDDTTVLVCHKCENPGCVRPSHLYLGDKSSNKMDHERTLYGKIH